MIRLLARGTVVGVAGLLSVFWVACGSDEDDIQTPPAMQRVSQAAIEKYRWYLEENATALVDWTSQLRGQIVAGELGKAQSRYATSRVQYSQLEPAAQLFPGLDKRINGYAPQESGGEIIGFHRIEKGLFGEETTKGLKPVARKLLEDVGILHHDLKAAVLRPAQIATGAEGVLREVSTMKLAGRAEPYSHIDMVDVAANIEAAEAAFEALRPILASEDQHLVTRIEAQFVDVYAALKATGTTAREPQPRAPAAGASFVNYTDLTQSEVRSVTQATRPLVEFFAEARKRLGSV